MMGGRRGPERRLMAEVLGYGYLVAAGVGLLSVALPEPAGYDRIAIAAISGGGLAIAVGVLMAREAVPRWAIHALLLTATAMIAAAMRLSGDPATATEIPYLGIAAYAFYFLSWPAATLHAAAVLAAYGAIVLGADPEAVDLPVRLLVLGVALGIVGLVLGLVRQRTEHLVGRLSEEARTDPLTGVLNRRGFAELMEEELERASRGRGSLSVAIGDLDDFKQVNDRLGHLGGDMALERIGSLLRVGVRRIDTVARLGGEEFALVLPQTDKPGALVLADRLRERVAEDFAGRTVPLTFSFGIATYPEDGRTMEELLHAADHAMYAGKAGGKNRTVAHGEEAAAVGAGTERPPGRGE